jgi:GNAT superfamily N-acetyltransferase
MRSESVIRQALPADRSGVLETVTLAFAEDPAWGFLMSDDYERLAPQFVGAMFDLRAGRGNVWISDDIASVAMWESPSGEENSARRTKDVWTRYRAVAGEQAYDRLIAYREAVAAASPPERYWYLGVLATRPARQREGLATSVLAPVLEAADRGGIACCLETSTGANRGFYERRGFTEPTEVALAGGPPTWWLRRPPWPKPASVAH